MQNAPPPREWRACDLWPGPRSPRVYSHLGSPRPAGRAHPVASPRDAACVTQGSWRLHTTAFAAFAASVSGRINMRIQMSWFVGPFDLKRFGHFAASRTSVQQNCTLPVAASPAPKCFLLVGTVLGASSYYVLGWKPPGPPLSGVTLLALLWQVGWSH